LWLLEPPLKKKFLGKRILFGKCKDGDAEAGYPCLHLEGRKAVEQRGSVGFGKQSYVLALFSCPFLNISPGPPLSWTGHQARWENQAN